MFDSEIISVLPRHSTEFERALEQSSLWVLRNSEIAKTWNPDECPEHLLPWLGWGVSVDRWEPEWDIERRRLSVKNSVFIHTRKGTPGSVKRTLEAFGYAAEISEWFQSDGASHTFLLWIDADGDVDLTESYVAKIRSAIDAVKPVRSHYDMSFRFSETVGIYAGGYSRVQIVANAPAKLFSVPILTASGGPKLGLETHIHADAEARP